MSSKTAVDNRLRGAIRQLKREEFREKVRIVVLINTNEEFRKEDFRRAVDNRMRLAYGRKEKDATAVLMMPDGEIFLEN